MRKAATPATARRPTGATAMRAYLQVSSICTNRGTFRRGTYTSILISLTILVAIVTAIAIAIAVAVVAIGLGGRLGLGAGSPMTMGGAGAGRGAGGALGRLRRGARRGSRRAALGSARGALGSSRRGGVESLDRSLGDGGAALLNDGLVRRGCDRNPTLIRSVSVLLKDDNNQVSQLTWEAPSVPVAEDVAPWWVLISTALDDDVRM